MELALEQRSKQEKQRFDMQDQIVPQRPVQYVILAAMLAPALFAVTSLFGAESFTSTTAGAVIISLLAGAVAGLIAIFVSRSRRTS